MTKEIFILKETVHMIKTHPIKTLAFFGGCGAIVGTGYCTKLRMDTNEAIRKTHDDTNEAIRKELTINAEKLKYLHNRNELKKEVNDENIRMVKIMNELKKEENDEKIRKVKITNELKKEANHEEIRARRSRIPWIIRWLM